jgi:putative hydrolase of the HAD superfamily
MDRPSLLLWDVGGVLLSNGWDRPAREDAAKRFGLDPQEFEQRHERVVDRFEKGTLDASGYLAETVFYAPRAFSPEEFLRVMRDQSRANETALATARALRDRGDYVMAALNNESRELNEHRIRAFRLDEIFHAFFSSCYTGFRKPEPEAYRFALTITHREPGDTLFLDDRPENVAAAARIGIRTLLVQDPKRIGEELAVAGVAAS